MASILLHPSVVAAMVGIVLGVLGFMIQRTIFKEIDTLKAQKVDTQVCVLRESQNEKDLAELKNIIEKIDAKLDALMVQVARMNGLHS